jgi:hypothetical protein
LSGARRAPAAKRGAAGVSGDLSAHREPGLRGATATAMLPVGHEPLPSSAGPVSAL